ncbi:MAG TPA: hypothetical protein O0X27_01195 [Methanocorpusculum sp.]|nr:hypothetical protein [Methanocorpusculum sp.]
MTRRIIQIPPMLTATINMGLSALDGLLFKDLAKCPHCGGRPMPYDTKQKQYVTLIVGGEERIISVSVRRFICHDCGQLIYAEEPFYPDTRMGSAIADLALCLSRTTSYTRAAAIMQAMGIYITRSTVRNYALSTLPMPEVSMMYGLPMPYSFMSLMGRGISAVHIKPEEVLASSGYPSRYRVPADGIGIARQYFLHKKEMKKNPQTF